MLRPRHTIGQEGKYVHASSSSSSSCGQTPQCIVQVRHHCIGCATSEMLPIMLSDVVVSFLPEVPPHAVQLAGNHARSLTNMTGSVHMLVCSSRHACNQTRVDCVLQRPQYLHTHTGLCQYCCPSTHLSLFVCAVATNTLHRAAHVYVQWQSHHSAFFKTLVSFGLLKVGGKVPRRLIEGKASMHDTEATSSAQLCEVVQLTAAAVTHLSCLAKQERKNTLLGMDSTEADGSPESLA